MKVKLTMLLISGIFLMAEAGMSQKFYDLQYKYKKGKSYRYTDVNSFGASQEMNGEENELSGGTTSKIILEVESIAKNRDITFIKSYEEMSMSYKVMGRDTTMMQNDIIGKRVRLIISKLGNEISLTPIDSIKARKGIGDIMGAVSKSNLFILPDHKVKTGDKWETDENDTTSIGTEGKTFTKFHHIYTVEEPEIKNGRNCLKFTFTSKSEITGKMIQMGMEMFLEGTGSSSGSAWFDLKQGILVARESVGEQDLTIALTGAMQMSIPSTQTMKSAFTLVD